jgi:2,3-bisphosphoglycerate-independent phosphoglycerate mutase
MSLVKPDFANSRAHPVVLCILDGWGARSPAADNAISVAETPAWDRLLAHCPHALLQTSGEAVGLPAGQMGNSEVGHANIGAGRVVMQDLPRINQAIHDGELDDHPALRTLIECLGASGGSCHLMGLISPGGVHAHQDHIVVIARLLAAAGIPVRIHAFLDGRDTPPNSARDFLQAFIEDLPNGAAVATVIGRYYAMDRDNRWERVVEAYDAMTLAAGAAAADPIGAIESAYARGESDEFVRPTVVGDFAGMADGDALIMANFRADRAREILTTLVDPAFDAMVRRKTVAFAAAVGMTEYSEALNDHLTTLFPSLPLTNVLGQVVADAGLSQLRIAETEKYAHVTFFLNGGQERAFAGEDRILVASPKVATYDLQPEMSAPEVTDRLCQAIRSAAFDFIVVNYANPDMVGHTGKLDAAIQAVECIDQCLDRLARAVDAAGGVMLVTADHGNIEQMQDPDSDGKHTAHTTNDVPIVVIGEAAAEALSIDKLNNGRLCDLAPTLLTFLGLPQPIEMTGQSLLAPSDQSGIEGHVARA